MRIKNLLIIIAIVAAILLVMRYVSQARETRRGYNFASNGRIFVNWLLVIILVGSLVGIGITLFTSHKETSAAPAPAKTNKSAAVEPAADDDITLSFKKTARLNSAGAARVKFLISPRTKVVIKGHRTGIVVQSFKPSKAAGTVTRSVTFDTAGTYDIIARRGDQKVVKHLKIKEVAADQSSSSSFSAVSSTSSSSSSASTASSQSNTSTAGSTANESDNGATGSAATSRSAAGGTAGGNYRGGTGYRGNNSAYRGNEAGNRGNGNATDNGQGSASTGNGALSGQQ